MKLVVTFAFGADAVYIGGDVHRVSYIMEIPDKCVPDRLKDYLENREKYQYTTVLFSLLEEDKRNKEEEEV